MPDGIRSRMIWYVSFWRQGGSDPRSSRQENTSSLTTDGIALPTSGDPCQHAPGTISVRARHARKLPAKAELLSASSSTEK